jgi:hypothetical protein
MSQMGMQLPGAQRARRATVDEFTGLLFAAVVVLLGALVVVYMVGATAVAPGDGPLDVVKMQEPGSVTLPRN